MFWSPSLSDVKKGVKSDVIIGYRQINKKNCVNAKKERKTGQKETTKKDCQCKDDVEMNNKKEQEEKEKEKSQIIIQLM